MKTGMIGLGFCLPASPALADQCVGSVVSGNCIGVIQRGPGSLYQRPDDSFDQQGDGFKTRPNPEPVFGGNEFHNNTQPTFRGGELRWGDPSKGLGGDDRHG